MENIYSYYDYHKFLADFYAEKKQSSPIFSYRYLSQKIGIDHALIVKIFQGNRHISTAMVPKFATAFGLSKRQAEYFELLVMYGKAKNDREIKHYFEQMLAFSEVGARKVDIDKYQFYQKWYYTAIREVIALYSFTGNYTGLAKLIEPEITPSEAKKSIELLGRLGFIKKDGQGIYRQTDAFITTGEEWKSIAVRSFQKETMALGISAIENVPKEERDISTVTLTLDDDGFMRARERIKQMQNELFDLSAKCRIVNRVYQVNMQVFPLSKKVDAGVEHGYTHEIPEQGGGK